MTWRPPRGKLAKPLAATIDDAKLDFGETDQPVAGFGFGDAHRLADQRLAEEDQVAAPADLAPAADLTHDVIGIVPGLLGLVGIGSQRSPVAACRRHLAQALVGPAGVEIIGETVEDGLGPGPRGGGR